MIRKSPLAAALRIDGLTVRLGNREVLRHISLDVRGGTTLSIVGESGSGKTTLLRAIAGLVTPTAGEITLAARRVERMPPNRRVAVYLSQEPLLFPHLDVYENLVFGLRLRRAPEESVKRQARELLAELGLENLERRHPTALSGGQRQRVAFGRALIIRPLVLLLDEPFSSLDPQTRAGMQKLFKEVAHQHRITSLFVAHDLKESLRMGDSFAILRDGRLLAYRDRADFCADPATGVAEEADFWAEAVTGQGRAPAHGAGGEPAC